MTNRSLLFRFGHYLVALAVLIVAVAANIASTLDQNARMGRSVGLGGPLMDEITSALVWLALVPLIVRAFEASTPSRLSIPTIAAMHLALAPAVSLVHFVATRVLRALGYAAFNEGFVFRFAWGDYVADLYRDLLTYLLLGLICWSTQRLLKSPAVETGTTIGPPPPLEIRDGAKTSYVAVQDILWVEAAGNYVELHLVDGHKRLMRNTLASLASRLADCGILRIHRSRLVNIAAVREVTNLPSGDATLHLSDGTSIVASRSHRTAVTSALAARGLH